MTRVFLLQIVSTRIITLHKKMEKSRYKPKVIDTRAVEIPKELEVLTETLARNTHEVWADSRMKEGYVLYMYKQNY